VVIPEKEKCKKTSKKNQKIIRKKTKNNQKKNQKIIRKKTNNQKKSNLSIFSVFLFFDFVLIIF